MKKKILDICQVALARDMSLIKENLLNFNKIYGEVQFHIVVPKKEKIFFIKELPYKNIDFYEEEELIPFEAFKNIFLSESEEIIYKKEFQNRLSWYYQQILKIIFISRFIKSENKSIVIWDADTVILKKIDFFDQSNQSIKYGNIIESHKPYYKTLLEIFRELPKYFISSLNQFIAITPNEYIRLENKLNNIKNEDFEIHISKIILKGIFSGHFNYNGSLFSEYEFFGISKLLDNMEKQKIILFLRSNLNGRLTNSQKSLAKFFNFVHVTYEHSHHNDLSQGMLNRNQTWLAFIKILIKNLVKNCYRKAKHNYNYWKSK